MPNSEWIPTEGVDGRLPDGAGVAVLVSALNCYNQRAEFIAFQGYGDFKWYTNDLIYISHDEDCKKKNEVSKAWRITHWRPLQRFDGVKLEPVFKRPKSEKYACSGCGGFCYFPHSRKRIPYKYCPNCGKEVYQ